MPGGSFGAPLPIPPHVRRTVRSACGIAAVARARLSSWATRLPTSTAASRAAAAATPSATRTIRPPRRVSLIHARRSGYAIRRKRTLTRQSSPSREDPGHRRAVDGVIDDLRRERQSSDAAKPPTDDAEVECRDGEPAGEALRQARPARQQPGEDNAPPEGEGRVHRDRSRDELSAPLLLRQQDRSGREGRGQRIFAARERPERRGE